MYSKFGDKSGKRTPLLTMDHFKDLSGTTTTTTTTTTITTTTTTYTNNNNREPNNIDNDGFSINYT